MAVCFETEWWRAEYLHCGWHDVVTTSSDCVVSNFMIVVNNELDGLEKKSSWHYLSFF